MIPQARQIIEHALWKRGRQATTPRPTRLTALKPGDQVIVRDADGGQHHRIAATGVVHGQDFWVVWVTALGDYTPGDCIPWPVEDVRVAKVPG